MKNAPTQLMSQSLQHYPVNTLLSIPEIPFTTLIDAEHAYLTTLAHKLPSPTLSPSSFTTLLHEIVWRLIRHDISEDLIMRPAFAQHLGNEGRAMANRDRDDHSHVKSTLLDIMSRSNNNTDDINQRETLRELKPLLKDMEMHMRHESGVQLVKFRGQVAEDEARRLGAMYAVTLALGPDLEVLETRDEDGDGKRTGRTDGTRRRLFAGKGGFDAFIRADVHGLGDVLVMLVEDAASGCDGGYLEGRIKAEMERIGVGRLLTRL